MDTASSQRLWMPPRDLRTTGEVQTNRNSGTTWTSISCRTAQYAEGRNLPKAEVAFRERGGYCILLSRRLTQRILGAIWLLDGLLQLKPAMFTQAFVTGVILPSAEGQPRAIADLVDFAAHLVSGHMAEWNILFTLIQLALGVLLLSDRWVRPTLVASMLWALIVWIVEGIGMPFGAQMTLLNGAPGAGIVYALVSLAVWPTSGDPNVWLPWSQRFAQFALGAIWLFGFVLQLEWIAAFPSAGATQVSVPRVSGMVMEGMPAQSTYLSLPLSDPQLSRLLAPVGEWVVIGLAMAALLIGILWINGQSLAPIAWFSLLLLALFWWLGQSFGGIWTALATDPNAAPLIALLVLCATPRRKLEPSHASGRLKPLT